VQVLVPGSDLWQKAANLAAGGAALTASASAMSAAAATVSTAGTTSLLRSVGHTQFLAMSVSLAIPFLPPEYVRLCQGLE
jgi:hypothetical protein